MEELVTEAASGAMEYVFGGLFVGLFLFVLWEKRQTERRLTEQNEKLATALQSMIANLGAVETGIRTAIREELQGVLRWLKQGE